MNVELQSRIGYGTTQRRASIVAYGDNLDKLAIQVTTDLGDKERLAVMMSKMLTAASKAEDEIEMMSRKEVGDYFGNLDKSVFDKIIPKP